MFVPSRTGESCVSLIVAWTNGSFPALRLSFGSMICVVMSAYTPAPSPSNAHGESDASGQRRPCD